MAESGLIVKYAICYQMNFRSYLRRLHVLLQIRKKIAKKIHE